MIDIVPAEAHYVNDVRKLNNIVSRDSTNMVIYSLWEVNVVQYSCSLGLNVLVSGFCCRW
jgi:hypothetical protein